jgi:hypothetical protein
MNGVKFIAELQKIKPVDKFNGGVASQRDKLNKMADALNAITDTARRCVDPKNVPDSQRVVIIINGQETPVLIPMEFTT